MTDLKLRYARIEGYDIDAMRAAVRMTNLPEHGDCRLVWVSTGDLNQMLLSGEAEECKRG
jgi:hypothetical protein